MFDSPAENTATHEQEHPTHMFWGEEDQVGHGCHALCLNFWEELVSRCHDAVHVGYGSPYRQADTLGGVAAPSLLFLTAKAKLVSQETREVRKGEGQYSDRIWWLPYCQGFPLDPLPREYSGHTPYQSHLGNLVGGASRTPVPAPPEA